jgi:hypothetical protein
LLGYKIAAIDSHLGKVYDFYFDDFFWSIRYLVADTRRWLPGRKVLISPFALKESDWKTRLLSVNLSKQQIKESPPISEDEPISRQYETELTKYYGWPVYWGALGGGSVAVNARALAQLEESKQLGEIVDENESHLRSVREVKEYSIQATDARIGQVDDFILDDESWMVRYLVVDTKKWIPASKRVLIAPNWIDHVDWLKREVKLNLNKQKVASSPQYHPSDPINREYETRLYDYYGRPVYWANQ